MCYINRTLHLCISFILLSEENNQSYHRAGAHLYATSASLISITHCTANFLVSANKGKRFHFTRASAPITSPRAKHHCQSFSAHILIKCQGDRSALRRSSLRNLQSTASPTPTVSCAIERPSKLDRRSLIHPNYLVQYIRTRELTISCI